MGPGNGSWLVDSRFLAGGQTAYKPTLPQIASRMWIGWILLGLENTGLWLVEHSFSASGENRIHTHTLTHTRYKTMASSMNREFFWALVWLVDCGFWATGQPKKNVTIGPLDHQCARCRACPTLKDVANWNYKIGLFFTIRRKDILNH